MKKEDYRDYVTAAFRFYARCMHDGVRPEAGTADADDFEAVSACMEEWSGEAKDTRDAVMAVYMVDVSADLRRGDIVNRVRRFAIVRHYDEATVYRMLREARRYFAVRRGLRL